MASVLVVTAIRILLVIVRVCDCVIPDGFAVKSRYAGYIDVGNKHQFYWFVEADNPGSSFFCHFSSRSDSMELYEFLIDHPL